MKRRLFCALTALVVLYILSQSAPPDLTAASRELVRLHVVADADDDASQALKLEVRDAVLAQTQALLSGCGGADEAYAALSGRLSELERAAADCLTAHGCDLPVRAELGVFDFPDRDYDGVTVPAGRYRALRIVIGSGQGHNWWCVLYPSLCVDTETPPVFYSAIGRWMRGVFQEVSGWLAGK